MRLKDGVFYASICFYVVQHNVFNRYFAYYNLLSSWYRMNENEPNELRIMWLPKVVFNPKPTLIVSNVGS